MDFVNKNLKALENRFFTETLYKNTTDVFVEIKTSRSGYPIPVLSNHNHSVTLHSVYDPVLEAQRLTNEYTNSARGLYVFLGLGGGYHIQEIIKKNPESKIIIIETNLNLFFNLIKLIDYSEIFSHENLFVYVDYNPEAFEEIIKQIFNYFFDTHCYTIPLRSRINFDNYEYFSACSTIIDSTIQNIASDIAIQAQFGYQWLKNIIKNFNLLKHNKIFKLPKAHVIITGAGPSLESYKTINAIKNQLHTHWLLATDTSAGFLLAHNIVPDAIISIDCQIYSTFHFKHHIPDTTTLFLDIASPSSLARKYSNVFFFGSYHPLCVYLSQKTNAFPLLDCSGGNVVSAACELVSMLGAQTVTVYGADFSYPGGSLYARGTYLYDVFQSQETRIMPLTTLFMKILFRTAIRRINLGTTFRYENELLTSYHDMLQKKIQNHRCKYQFISEYGLPIIINHKDTTTNEQEIFIQKGIDVNLLLSEYIDKLKQLQDNIGQKKYKESNLQFDPVFNTLLPLLAFLKKHSRDRDFFSLLQNAIELTIQKIETQLYNTNQYM